MATSSDTAARAPEQGAYPSIRDYAVIGDCRTIALVSNEGSIDWLCLPHFSGPSIFGALLDAARGGRFAIRAQSVKHVERRYLPGTPILETTFHCADDGVVRLTDFMSITDDGGEPAPAHEIVRVVECVRGTATVAVEYAPRPGYAGRTARLRDRGKLGWHLEDRSSATTLVTDLPLHASDASTLTGTVTLHEGERRTAVLASVQRDTGVLPPPGDAVLDRLDATRRWWREWSDRCTYRGPYREAVSRSCLTLKLLAYSASGAVMAAATTSLPEGSTGERNWDYRYCWLRDTSLVLQSFVDTGYPAESEAFLGWLLHVTRLTRPRLQVVYDLFGETNLPERVIATLAGYRGLGPVRVGNGAHRQLQLDVYGEVVLTASSYVDRGGRLDSGERSLLAGFGDAVLALWREPDASIWEIRSGPRHNTYSKLMCWVALDRLLALADSAAVPVDRERLSKERDAIRADIDANGYDAKLGAYVGYYGGTAADASLLLMARYGFLDARDPRMLGTARHIETTLGGGGARSQAAQGLLYRYPPGRDYDGVGGEDNLFCICSFWLVDYLARAGEVERAAALFERLLGLGNDVGLYAEEYDAHDLSPLGNFPQAFSHVGLVTAALALEQAWRAREQQGPEARPSIAR